MNVIPKGAAVRQIVKPITGTVIEARLNHEAGAIEYHVSYGEGDSARWFLASEIEIDPDATKPAEAPATPESAS